MRRFSPYADQAARPDRPEVSEDASVPGSMPGDVPEGSRPIRLRAAENAFAQLSGKIGFIDRPASKSTPEGQSSEERGSNRWKTAESGPRSPVIRGEENRRWRGDVKPTFPPPKSTQEMSPEPPDSEIVGLRELEELKRILKEKQEEEERRVERLKVRGGPRQLFGDIDGVKTPTTQLALDILSWKGFDPLIGAIIAVNAVTIGVATSYEVKEEAIPNWVHVLELVFLAIYTIECGLRLYAHGPKRALRSNWVRFDVFLAVIGYMSLLVEYAMKSLSGIEAFQPVLEQLMLVRLMRLCRLARTVRLMIQFKVLWQLVQGMMGSAPTIVWTFVLITLLIYMFALLGMHVISHVDGASEEHEAAVLMFTDGVGFAMLTLAQFLMLDSIGGIYRPLVVQRPWLIFYFALFILLVSVAVLNLVTAVMVDSAMQQSTEDREVQRAWEDARKKALLPKIKAMFLELDSDGSGELDIQELLDAPEAVKMQLQEIANMEDCEELFHMLDYDGGGSVEVDEFVDGIMKAQGDKPMELLRLMRQCTDILKNSRETLEFLKNGNLSAGGTQGGGAGGGGVSDVEFQKLSAHVDRMERHMDSRLTNIEASLSRLLEATIADSALPASMLRTGPPHRVTSSGYLE